MESLLTFLWQSSLVLAVLFVPFILLLRKEHYYAINRAILLAILVLSLSLPFSRHSLPSFIKNWLNPEVLAEAAPIIEVGDAQIIDSIIVMEQAAIVEPSWFESHWTSLLFAIWVLGTAVFVLWQIRGLWRLYRILHDKDNIHETLEDGNTLLLTPAPLPSFSWMRSIVISVDDYAENGETILMHERAHIAYRHSLDRMLLLLVQTLQWWNPFVWLMADALSQVHEYQADQTVLNQGINATQYQLLLIRKAAGPAGLAMVNGFKRNKLKLRIVMMNNMINLRGAKSRYLALLPMMLLAVAFTARAEVTTRDDQNAATDAPTTHYQATWTAWDEDEVLDACDQMPEYPGGLEALAAFISENLRYPMECAHQGIEGRVTLSFIVEKDGSISHIEERNSPDSLLTAEAIRVVKSMSKWTPGKQDGQLVRVGYTLPFRFQLKGQGQGSDQEKEAARTNPISDGPYSADMLYIYDGNVVEFEAIKDLPPTEIAIGIIQVLKSGEIYEEYLQKYPNARNGVVIMNSYSRKDQLWVVDGVPMTGEEMEVKYADNFQVQFQQLRKDAETLAKYSQYPAAKNGVNIVFTKKN